MRSPLAGRLAGRGHDSGGAGATARAWRAEIARRGALVLKHIRSSPGLQAIPAVVVTARPVESDRIRASLLGASNYLAKAMDLDEFALLLKISLRPFI